MENTRKKPISKKKYACCPNCTTVLIHAETVLNATTKCPTCNQKVAFEINDGKVLAYLLNNLNYCSEEEKD